MKLEKLVKQARNKENFKSLNDYIFFASRYLEFVEDNLQAVIVSRNENNYRFFQYKKVVCESEKVCIQSTNINGTLNWGGKWKIPERIEQIKRKANSSSTLLVSFAGGWQLSFRLHNARSAVEPSLKFDIQFVGLPQNVAKHKIQLSN